MRSKGSGATETLVHALRLGAEGTEVVYICIVNSVHYTNLKSIIKTYSI